MLKRRTQAGLLLAMALAAGAAGRACPHVDRPPCPPPARAQLAELASWIRGEVVYQREDGRRIDGIYKTVVGRPESILLARHGRYPRWSPDGRHIAFLRGTNLVMHMTAGGHGLRVLARPHNARVLQYHPDGREVWFNDGFEIKAVSIESGQVRTVLAGHPVRAFDAGPRGRLVAVLHGRIITAFDLDTGRSRTIDKGCSAVFSPDGEFITDAASHHRSVAIRRWDTGETVGSVRAPPGSLCDNEFWSNRPDWIASSSAFPAPRDILLHHVPSNRTFQVTFTGDCNRPDLFVAWERGTPEESPIAAWFRSIGRRMR